MLRDKVAIVMFKKELMLFASLSQAQMRLKIFTRRSPLVAAPANVMISN